MNAAFLAKLQSASAAAQSVLGESFTLAGTTYTGTFASTQIARAIELAGIGERAELRLVATKAQFASTPWTTSARLQLTARGRPWSIVKVDTDDLHYLFDLKPAS